MKKGKRVKQVDIFTKKLAECEPLTWVNPKRKACRVAQDVARRGTFWRLAVALWEIFFGKTKREEEAVNSHRQILHRHEAPDERTLRVERLQKVAENLYNYEI